MACYCDALVVNIGVRVQSARSDVDYLIGELPVESPHRTAPHAAQSWNPRSTTLSAMRAVGVRFRAPTGQLVLPVAYTALQIDILNRFQSRMSRATIPDSWRNRDCRRRFHLVIGLAEWQPAEATPW